MALEVRTVKDRRDLRAFINLPARIHKHHAEWIPPIYMDDWRFFDAKKNLAFEHSDTILALAWRDRKPVGRIMGIVNRRSNELKQELVARFGFLESYEEQETCTALLEFIERWASGLGMKKLVGPMGFSDQNPQGLLIEGFDQEPTLVAYHNFAFLPRLVEAAGYTKEVDCVDYVINLQDGVPDFYEKIAVRVARQTEFRLLEFTKMKELLPFIQRIINLMDVTFVNLYGYVPMTQPEMDALAKQYVPILDSRFVKLVVRGEEVVGFIIGIPNMNVGLRRCKGRLFPFGFLQIAAAMKKAKRLDLFLGAVREDFRGRGVDVLLGAAMIRSAIGAGFTQLDSHRELETNLKVRAEMERVGGQVAKRFRIYQKPL